MDIFPVCALNGNAVGCTHQCIREFYLKFAFLLAVLEKEFTNSEDGLDLLDALLGFDGSCEFERNSDVPVLFLPESFESQDSLIRGVKFERRLSSRECFEINTIAVVLRLSHLYLLPYARRKQKGKCRHGNKYFCKLLHNFSIFNYSNHCSILSVGSGLLSSSVTPVLLWYSPRVMTRFH